MKKVLPNFSGNVALISAKAGKNFFVLAFVLLISLAGFAHSVDSYSASCGAGPQYTVTATISNVNSTSNYRWQWKNTSGAWVCFVNGANTINGTAYNVSGAVYNLTTVPGPIVFTNPNSGLQGLEIRMVISDGNGVDPCTLPAGNTWTSTTNHFINVNNTPCGASTCNGRVTNLYFNELNNGPDLPITNGSTFTVAQLASLYNLEAGTSGTIGSVKYTITGPTPTSNIENTTPYNSPATGSGAWTGAVGTYAVNLKTYSAADATGNLCHDTTITFTLVSGTTGSIGDRVWLDANGNGLQDATETGGITGVLVQLRNSVGTVIATTNTNASGNYLFSGLAAGTYSVAFPVSLSGSVVTTANVGSDDNIDSDPSQTTGVTPNIVLAAGQNITNVDAGYCPVNLQLGNRVWYDTNNNGINDASENGIRNITVSLYKDDNNDDVADGAALATVLTDVNGNYLFSNLAPGNYIAGAVIPAGYMSSAVNGGDPDNNTDLDDNGQVAVGSEIRGLAITLTGGAEPTSGNTNNTYDFGLLPDCNCTTSASNLLVNGNFENGTTGWSWSGGTLTTGTGYIACGAANGFNNWSSGTSKVYQDVAMAAGSTVTFNAFAGTHTPGITCSPTLSLIFLNAANTVLGQSNVTVTRDVDINNSQLEQYSITAVAPAGTTKVRVQSSITCNTMKMDAFCLTATAPPVASLGDRVWIDDNKNGVQDAGEPGVSGIGVSLFDNTGKLVGAVVTDAYGNYLFSKLTAGDYTVGFALPANYTFTTSAGTSEADATNSDVNAVTGVTTTVNLSPGENQTNIDAGVIFNTTSPKANIGDRVWLDLNGDGVQNAGEPGVSGVTVTLYDNTGKIVATAVTDANGNYLFTDVPPGTGYTIGFTAPAGTAFSPKDVITGGGNDINDSDPDPVTGRTAPFTVVAGATDLSFDAGLTPQNSGKASLGDRVWNDLNQNGIQDAGEPGIAGVTVKLYAADGTTLLNTTTTDAFGNYIFTNLAPGGYVIEFVKPTGYSASPVAAPGSTTANDSDPNVTTGKTGVVTLVAGDRNTSVDAGMYRTTPPGVLKIGDFVWNDLNRDGVQGATEIGIAGITVTLYQNGPDGLPGTADDVKIGSTTTNNNGGYQFTDLAASTGASTNYSIQFSNLPTGYSFTTQVQTNSGGNTTNDSDPNTVTGRTGSINLTANNLTVDAGLVQGIPSGKGSIGDRVWYDMPGGTTGVQDPTELGVSGITVKLYNDANKDGVLSGAELTAIATTTTNALGYYLFGGLDAGLYQVGFSNLPALFTLTTKDAGTDDAKDSDGNPLGSSVAGNTATAGTTYTGLFSLPVGDDNLTVDLGIVPPANTNSLGGDIWADKNSDGLQTVGEPPVKGVMVTLYNSAGVAIATTTTDANGKYLFVGLPDGSYSVGFSNLPAGYNFTTKSATNDALGSDADVVTGRTTTVTLGVSNRNDTSLDAGLVTTKAALGDYVWLDTNADGVQDATESGIAGVTVTLTRPGFGLDGIAGNADDALPVASAITDATGNYFFSNLTPGSYQVGFSTIPSNLSFTKQNTPGDNQNNTNSDADPVTGLSALIVLSAGETDVTVDAGVSPKIPASIGDFVWLDLNRDGLQDAGEPGVPGVIVTLYNSANQPIGSAVTDGNGFYQISNVPPGTGYYVKFSNQPDATAPWTLQNVGGVGASNNSKVDATGQTGTFNVAAGDNVTNLDAGIYKKINLSGNVWHDVNAMTDNLVNNSGAAQIPPAAQIPANLRAYLVNLSTGLVEKIQPINPFDGTFTFTDVTPNTNYYILISSAFGIINQPPPVATLPSGWGHTGQKLYPSTGPITGSDGLNDGRLIVPVGTSNVINANFGIKLNGGDVVIG